MMRQGQGNVLKAINLLSESLPVEGKMAVLEQLLEVLQTRDLSQLSDADRKKLLSLLPPSSQGADLESNTATAPVTSDLMDKARKIVGTLAVGRDSMIRLTIPAGLGDIEAMKALNLLFREQFPEMGRGAIFEGDLPRYAEQPGVAARDVNKERRIIINPLVSGTLGFRLNEQQEKLEKIGLTLGAPEEVALVVAAYACKHGSADLLRALMTRTSTPGVELTTISDRGVIMLMNCLGSADSEVGASGVARPAH